MSKDIETKDSSQILGFARSVIAPVFFAVTSIATGTVGYLLYLQNSDAFSNSSTMQVFIEGFFRSLGFLVLSMGTISPPNSLAFALLTLGRIAGLLFFFSAAIIGLGFVFAKRLRPVKIELWSLLGRLPGFEDRGHIIVCGVGDNGYNLAVEAIRDSRNVVAIDTKRTDRTADLKAMGAVVFNADAQHEGVIARRAGLSEATDVFVTTGSDATNGAIIETINEEATNSDQPQVTDVTARIRDHRLRRALHEEASAVDSVHFQTYDVPEATAWELLAATPVDDIEDFDQRVHVWLVGWTTLSEALLKQLLHLMHYPDGVDRQVTIIATDPDQIKREINALFPGADASWWDDSSMSAFVSDLFPDIEVRQLPTSDMELLSDQTQLYELFRQRDNLTIFADDTDERSLRALISTWGPKLDQLSREFELDTRLIYRSQEDAGWTPGLTDIETTTYTNFGDGCSISSVRGEKRDRTARQLALVYHLLYDDNLLDELPDRESLPAGIDNDIESVIDWLVSLPSNERERYETTVWRDLPEYQRESNRYAAAHVAIKYRMASVIDNLPEEYTDETIWKLAESEHRRWCAEKILNGWEPLPSEQKERWKTERGEQALRAQRYHPDIQPVESLRKEIDGEWNKDVSQVEAILRHPEIVSYRSNSSE